MNQEKTAWLNQKIKEEYSNVAGIVILKNAEVQYEDYFNGCTAESRIHVYSVTKSIMSILLGIAMDKGCIRGIEQKVLEYFPEYEVKKGQTAIRDITLEHLLTMTAPYKYWLAPYRKYFTSDDWVRFSLGLLGGRGKIGKFRYAPLIGPDILSGILIKATGQSVLEFAMENLFKPLGIQVEGSIIFQSKEEQLAFSKATDISGWAADPKGVNAAGWGLTLSAMDMAKIGQMYLNGGEWKGNQIVSGKWVKESTLEHSRWKKLGLPYGYLWWISNEKGPGYAAMGDGGNTIYVNEDSKTVVAITSLFIQKPKDRIVFIHEIIEPLLKEEEEGYK